YPPCRNKLIPTAWGRPQIWDSGQRRATAGPGPPNNGSVSLEGSPAPASGTDRSEAASTPVGISGWRPRGRLGAPGRAQPVDSPASTGGHFPGKDCGSFRYQGVGDRPRPLLRT